MYTIS